MIGHAVGAVLALVALAATKGAAKLAPRREVDVFTHRDRAKPWWYLDAHLMQPGWLWVEVGRWTIEVAWKTGKDLAA